jgi:ferredoxin
VRRNGSAGLSGRLRCSGCCPISGVAAHWKASAYQSILELAEACDVPVRWSCRTGVCHSCESGLVSGAVVYGPEALDKPADGNVLVCCSQPDGDVVIDL